MPEMTLISATKYPALPALVDALRDQGWEVSHNPATIAPSATCVVLLDAASRDAAMITNAANAGYQHAIPVFLEPMILPSGRWTSSPIPPQLTPADLALRIQQAIAAPRQAAPIVDHKAIRQRERQLGWQRAKQQIIAVAVVVGIIAVGAICRFLYYSTFPLVFPGH